MLDAFSDTGCSGHGVESAPPLGETNWTSFMIRTRLWIISAACMRKRQGIPGHQATSQNTPISFTLSRLTTDR